MSADDKAAAAWNDYVSQQQEEKIEELERQLAAANERIKQLEDARTVAAANSLANMLAYEDAVSKIERLEDACDEAIAFCEILGPVGATPYTACLIAKSLRKAKESKP